LLRLATPPTRSVSSEGNNAAEFVELELKPVPSLSITPGFKHLDYNRKIDAAYNQTTRYAQRLSNSWGANLPFLQANVSPNGMPS
jgi:iron complex outermembrane receptor protein